ncbi:hypothetical protein PAENIP36_56950 [Paenibacillus sp. P36]
MVSDMVSDRVSNEPKLQSMHNSSNCDIFALTLSCSRSQILEKCANRGSVHPIED